MDINSIASIAGSIGIPAVMCFIIFNYLEEEQKSHKEEIMSLKDVINDLRVAITSLTERLDKHNDT